MSSFVSRLGLFLLLIITGCASTVPKHEQHVIVFENASLIDGTSDQIKSRQTVVVVGNTINKIYKTGSHKAPRHAIIIDLSGATLLPGLINGHVHLSPNENRENDLKTMALAGVTTVRDAGGDARLLRKLAATSELDDQKLPRIIYSATLFGEKFMSDPHVKLAARGMAPGEAPWMRLVTEASNTLKPSSQKPRQQEPMALNYMHRLTHHYSPKL